MLVGGDAAMGHFTYRYPEPITETQKWSAYPGCYALSKVRVELHPIVTSQYSSTTSYRFPTIFSRYFPKVTIG